MTRQPPTDCLLLYCMLTPRSSLCVSVSVKRTGRAAAQMPGEPVQHEQGGENAPVV